MKQKVLDQKIHIDVCEHTIEDTIAVAKNE